MRIAVLGMGRMGRALAGRLQAGGHRLTVWNRTPGRAPEVVARGAREAAGVGDAVAGAQLVVTSLADDEAVAAIALGDGGVRSAIAPGAVYADASTASPALSRRLEESFPRFAAMPILASPAGVAAGSGRYLVGCRREVRTLLEPVVASLSETVSWYDDPTQASTAKLASNLLLLDGVVALSESVALGRAGGLSDDQLRELLGSSPMLAPGLKNRFEGVLTGDLDPWWTAALGAKDARLAVETVAGRGGELPLTACAQRRYQEASAVEPGGDIVAVAALYRPPGRPTA